MDHHRKLLTLHCRICGGHINRGSQKHRQTVTSYALTDELRHEQLCVQWKDVLWELIQFRLNTLHDDPDVHPIRFCLPCCTRVKSCHLVFISFINFLYTIIIMDHHRKLLTLHCRICGGHLNRESQKHQTVTSYALTDELRHEQLCVQWKDMMWELIHFRLNTLHDDHDVHPIFFCLPCCTRVKSCHLVFISFFNLLYTIIIMDHHRKLLTLHCRICGGHFNRGSRKHRQTVISYALTDELRHEQLCIQWKDVLRELIQFRLNTLHDDPDVHPIRFCLPCCTRVKSCHLVFISYINLLYTIIIMDHHRKLLTFHCRICGGHFNRGSQETSPNCNIVCPYWWATSWTALHTMEGRPSRVNSV